MRSAAADVRRRLLFSFFFSFLSLLHHHILAKCYYSFDSEHSKSGNFSSPKFPANYPGGISCQYVFQGEDFEGLKISFFMFELEEPYKTGCLMDYLDITTVNRRNERHLVGRFCGTDTPAPVLTMQPQAELLFRTNYAIQRKGFYANYEFLHERDTPAPTSTPGRTNCGGILSGVGGVVTSPGFPSFIPDNLDCVWLIRVDAPRHVHVKVSELQFHGSLASCERMELSFYDGYSGFSQNARKLQSLCGDLKYYRDIDDKTILSPRNRLLVRLQVSEGIRTGQGGGGGGLGIVGFKLIWTQVTMSDINQCPSFVCQRSNYCVRSTPTGSCSKTKQYCIDNSLVCDGIPNCSDNDNSDEDNCYMPFVIGIGACVPVILILLIVATVVVKRRVRVKKSSSQTQSLTMQLRQLEHSPSSSSRQISNYCYSQPCDLLSPTSGGGGGGGVSGLPPPELMNGLTAPYDAYGGLGLGGLSVVGGNTDDDDDDAQMCRQHLKGIPTPV